MAPHTLPAEHLWPDTGLSGHYTRHLYLLENMIFFTGPSLYLPDLLNQPPGPQSHHNKVISGHTGVMNTAISLSACIALKTALDALSTHCK